MVRADPAGVSKNGKGRDQGLLRQVELSTDGNVMEDERGMEGEGGGRSWDNCQVSGLGSRVDTGEISLGRYTGGTGVEEPFPTRCSTRDGSTAA